MKTISVLILTMAFVQLSLGQRSPNNLPVTPGEPKTDYHIVERGANQRILEKVEYEMVGGNKVPHIHRVIEMATGMHYLKNGHWIESKEEIDILADGTAAAIQGQHQVFFPADIYDGVIEEVTPDGKHLKSRPAGLSYFDGKNYVVIADLKHSVGQLVGNNQIIYPDAFTDVKADLRYTYTKAGFEQDIILKEQPPLPQEYGLGEQFCILESMTEFFDTPEPAGITPGADQSTFVRDETLTFGAMQMGKGRAFLASDKPLNSENSKVPVYKNWSHLEGRTFLFEDVSYQKLKPQLKILPTAQVDLTKKSGKPAYRQISSHRFLPPLRLAQNSTNAIQIATSEMPPARSVVLDYVTMNMGDTDFTFKGDSTYFISGPCDLGGTTTIEGGAVIKHTLLDSSINILGTIKCLTGAYRPAIFTQSGDESVGESVPCSGVFNLTITNTGGSGLSFRITDPFGGFVCEDQYVAGHSSQSYSFVAIEAEYYLDGQNDYVDVGGAFTPESQNGTLSVQDGGQTDYSETGSSLCNLAGIAGTALSLANGGLLHDLHIRNYDVGIHGDTNLSVMDVQFVHCNTAVEANNATVYSGNILMSDVGTGFDGANYGATVEHLTFDRGAQLASGDTNSTLTLVNSLLTSVTNYGTIPIYTNYIARLTNSAGIFQSGGDGNYYLTNNSPYRDSGTTNLGTALLAELKKKTTYPPVIYTGTIFSNITTLSPQASRDTNAPDLGYHYDPLDFIFGNVKAYTNMTVTAGTAVGWHMVSTYGIWLAKDNVVLTFDGTATERCVYTAVPMVQEGGTWTVRYANGGIFGNGVSGTWATAPQIIERFTLNSSPDGDCVVFHDQGTPLIASATHCEFVGGGLGGYTLDLLLTNCLLDRTYLAMGTYTSAAFVMRNCSMIGQYIVASRDGSTWPLRIQNCVFDATSFSIDNPVPGNTNVTYCNYNAFLTNAARLPMIGSNDVVITNFNWQTGPLGYFYEPTNSLLRDHGSTTADNLGLYHFTTQTNQTKEANSIVDIGYHYVAVDANGNPIDTDNDGLPDCVEDSNGNGVYDLTDFNDWLIPLFEQADPNNPSLGRLTITIDKPSDGSTF